jgi:hypothetical protein
MTLSVARQRFVEGQNNMNWRGFLMNQSWPNRVSVSGET